MKNIIIKIENNRYEILESNGIQSSLIDNGTYFTLNFNDELSMLDINSFLLNMKGIYIVQENDEIRIFTDIFRTIPLYYYKENEIIYLFTDFISIQKYSNFDKAIDEVGFWEYTLFGNGIYTRTIYKQVKQFTAAGKLIIKNKNIIFDYYWDFSFHENKKYSKLKEDKVSQLLKNKIEKSFEIEKIDKETNLTLGISGGMDSRLAFAIMKDLSLLKRTNFFTYGYDKRILESKIAQKLVTSEGLKKWSFHELNKESYQNGFTKFPHYSGGSISSCHVHMYDFLESNNTENLISTYYSDAVFGYATLKNKKDTTWKDVDYFKILNNFHDIIPKDIQNNITKDIELSLKNYKNNSSYSSIDEYKYIVERNPKFHMNLLFLQYQVTNKIFSPFADYEILKFMFEIPSEYRYDKMLIRKVIFDIDKKLIENNEDTSNQRVYFKKNFSSILNNLISNKQTLSILSVKLINLFLFKLTKGKFYIFDKYATEIHSNILKADFQKELDMALQYFLNKNMTNNVFYEKMKIIPPYGSDTIIRFIIIDLYKLLNKGHNSETN